jgi:hypothetical protein
LTSAKSIYYHIINLDARGQTIFLALHFWRSTPSVSRRWSSLKIPEIPAYIGPYIRFATVFSQSSSSPAESIAPLLIDILVEIIPRVDSNFIRRIKFAIIEGLFESFSNGGLFIEKKAGP